MPGQVIYSAAMNKLGTFLPQYQRLLAFVKPYRGRLAAGIVFGTLYGVSSGAMLSVVERVWSKFFEEGVSALPWWQAAGVVLLVIALRLSTVQHADHIIVLNKGRVVEQGTHVELRALGQTYKRLHELQFRT